MTRGVFGLLQVMQRHGVAIGRLSGHAALPLGIGLSVIILHGLFEIAGFGGVFIDGFHSAVRHLIRGFRADRLAGRLDDTLRRLMRRNPLFFESFTFTHRLLLKLSTWEK